MPNGTYGGVRGRKTKVGGKLLLRFPPTRLDFQALFYRNLINTILMASPLKLC